jgi:glycosyltransferase involved in cell wall biosynthesis
MKVVLDAQQVCTPVPSGIPTYVINLIKKLLERRKNDYLLTFFDQCRERNNRAYVEKYFGGYNVPLFECTTISYKDLYTGGNLLENVSYNEAVRAEGDAFHFMHLYPLPDTLTGKMIVTVHDLIPVIKPECFITEIVHRFETGCERLKKLNPVIISDSMATKADVVDYLGIAPERVFVTPLAHNKNLCYPEKNDEILRRFGIDCPYLLYLGDVYDPRKRIIDILAAFENISAKYDDLKLVFAGKHNSIFKTITGKLIDSRLTNKVIRTGYVSDEQKRALLSSAMVFLFPSEYEGFGLPVLEAMACGAPVITTDVSSLPEVAGDAAVLISPNDTEQLAHEIERLLDSETMRKKHIQMGFEQSRKFSWDKTAQMTEDVYETAYRS